MRVESPESPAQLCELLQECQQALQKIEIAGARTKVRMAGPVVAADVRIETKAMRGVLAYNPRDLTISVEAGMPYRDLAALLAANGQFIPIDPPFSSGATVGGILAANSTGHRRRLYGTVRDLVIGMQFVTLEGKLIQSGGMVVKNVAGLDFAKLLTGSFGTLACISVVNFKLMPKPPGARTFRFADPSAAKAFEQRDKLLRGFLQPSAVDILNPLAARRVGFEALWTLLVEAVGSESVLARYSRELPEYEETNNAVWDKIREFTPEYLNEFPAAHVIRVSCLLTEMERVMSAVDAGCAAIARGGNGVVYLHSAGSMQVPAVAKGVIEYSPAERPSRDSLWPKPGNDFFLMEKIKRMMDPDCLLNPGRLYGRI